VSRISRCHLPAPSGEVNSGWSCTALPHSSACCQQNILALLFYIVMVERTGCADIEISCLWWVKLSKCLHFLSEDTNINFLTCHVYFFVFFNIRKGQILTANCPKCNTSLSESCWIDWFQLTHVFIIVQK